MTTKDNTFLGMENKALRSWPSILIRVDKINTVTNYQCYSNQTVFCWCASDSSWHPLFPVLGNSELNKIHVKLILMLHCCGSRVQSIFSMQLKEFFIYPACSCKASWQCDGLMTLHYKVKTSKLNSMLKNAKHDHRENKHERCIHIDGYLSLLSWGKRP